MGRHPLAPTGLLAAALCLVMAGPPPRAAEPAVERAEFIYDHGPYPSVHASTLVESTSGQLVAAWFGGTEEGNPDVAIWVSRYERGGWTPSVKVADGVQDA